MWTCIIQTDERRALSKPRFFCLLASISQNDTNTKSNNFFVHAVMIAKKYNALQYNVLYIFC